MITRVELVTLAFEGPTPTRERKDFASDIFGRVEVVALAVSTVVC
jgi:hypothetical protein